MEQHSSPLSHVKPTLAESSLQSEKPQNDSNLLLCANNAESGTPAPTGEREVGSIKAIIGGKKQSEYSGRID